MPRGNERGPELSIKLDISDPTKKDDISEIVAIATVLFRWKYAPRPAREVVFLVNDALLDRVPTDEESGQAATTIPLEPGNYIITAYLKDFPGIRAVKRIPIKKEKPKLRVPTDLKVYTHPQGPAKNYYVSVEIFGEDKVGVNGWPLEIKDPANTKEDERSLVKKTDDDGAHRFVVETDGPREIFVSVVGTPLDYTLRLPGPTRRDLLPPPVVPDEVRNKGFWATVKYKVATDDNWRWLTLASIACVLLIFTVALAPYVLALPETSYDRTQRELYTFISELRGERAVLSRVGEVVAGGAGVAFRFLAPIVFGFATLVLLATAVYFVPAFEDDIRRALATVQIRMWDRYGGEIRSQGFFTKILVGRNPPAGSNPPKPEQIQPLTRGAFLFWEAIIDLVAEFIGRRFGR